MLKPPYAPLIALGLLLALPLGLLLGWRPELGFWLAWGAALWGLCSGLAELGLTAEFLRRLPQAQRLETALWLGLGTGLAEIVLILGFVLIQRESPGWTSVYERAYTLAGHVFSRGLTALGLVSPLILALTLGIFAGVDGLASYGHAKGWDFEEARTARRFHGVMAAVVVLEGLLLWGLSQTF